MRERIVIGTGGVTANCSGANLATEYQACALDKKLGQVVESLKRGNYNLREQKQNAWDSISFLSGMRLFHHPHLSYIVRSLSQYILRLILQYITGDIDAFINQLDIGYSNHGSKFIPVGNTSVFNPVQEPASWCGCTLKSTLHAVFA